MNRTAARPEYGSYLPPALRAVENSLFGKFVELYEILLAGDSSPARSLQENRVLIQDLDPVLLAPITASGDLQYEPVNSISGELVYLGEMSSTRRNELMNLAGDTAMPVVARQHYEAAISLLFEMSWRNSRPRRLLESWVDMDVGTVDESLMAALDGFNDVRYESESRRLVAKGPMSLSRYNELGALSSASDYQLKLERLFGRSNNREEEIPGLEVLLDKIHRYSDPLAAPTTLFDDNSGQAGFFDDDFIPFIASWVALAVKRNWSEAKKRRLISTIVPVYKIRGTPTGIRTLLEIFVESPVDINETLGLQVGVRATIPDDTIVGGLPHHFQVEIPYGFRDVGDDPAPFDFEFIRSITETTREVLDLEKPAHTEYKVVYRFPGIVVGEYATINYDTLIWPPGNTLEVISLGV